MEKAQDIVEQSHGYDLLAEPLMAPPPDPLTVVWHAIAPALTPEAIYGVIMTLAITHALKVIVAGAYPAVASTLARWRSFCTTLSVGVGAGVGLTLWYAGGPIEVMFVTAFLSGPAWRLILAVAPERIGAALSTDTDRSFRDDNRAQ